MLGWEMTKMNKEDFAVVVHDAAVVDDDDDDDKDVVIVYDGDD